MTASEVIAFLGQLEYEGDDRKAPDSKRLGRFKAGWGDATERGTIYREDTLRRLKWQNLGYRCGVKWGIRPDDEMEQVFKIHLAGHLCR
jgi:hypothetical protein